MRECGTTARVAQLIEELDDGRMNILVEGARRFRISSCASPTTPRPTTCSARGRVLPRREPEAPESCARRARGVPQDARAHGRRGPAEPAGEGPLSFRVAAAVDFGAPLKQELLESLSEEQRLETLLTVMTSLLPRLELRKEREEAIRGNGKGY